MIRAAGPQVESIWRSTYFCIVTVRRRTAAAARRRAPALRRDSHPPDRRPESDSLGTRARLNCPVLAIAAAALPSRASLTVSARRSGSVAKFFSLVYNVFDLISAAS